MTNLSPLSGSPLPPELSQHLQSELQPGELVIWTGQPDPNLLARRGIIFSVIGIFFVAVPLIMLGAMFVASHFAGSFFPFCFAPFVLLFLCIGVGITLMPLWNRRAALKTFYAVTNRRAIVWQRTLFSVNVRSFMPDQLTNLTRRELGNGSGDLVFYSSTYRDMDGDRHTTAVGFFAVPNVHQVEELLRASLLTSKT